MDKDIERIGGPGDSELERGGPPAADFAPHLIVELQGGNISAGYAIGVILKSVLDAREKQATPLRTLIIFAPNLTSVDSHFVGGLMALHERFRGRNVNVVFINDSPQITNVFKVLRADSGMALRGCLDEALREFVGSEKHQRIRFSLDEMQ